ncbi:uncharacterized protein LOC123564125 [Mercenaria mercenaria]|uniref:uncharacterized protein LOC123564125 n=1 Tax=Mercenaria mercenaria TaxID=6596 RepID=UPI001E1DD11C|nr:uncharacterized protein LOC123564125 [Mercenaria mercenaria]
MAAARIPSAVVEVTFRECRHIKDTRKVIKSIPHTKLLSDIFYEEHEEHQATGDHRKTLTFLAKCKTNINTTENFEIQGGMSVGTLTERFTIKCLEFTCIPSGDAEDEKSVAEGILKETNRKAVDAFKILMAGGRREFTKRKTSSSGMKDGLSRKDELFNDLVGQFQDQQLDWPANQASTDGAYFIQV